MRVCLIILGSLLVFSCGRQEKLPEGVLDQQKMEKLMTDVLLAESFAEGYLLVDTTRTREQAFGGELNKVLAIEKVSQKDFMRSLEFYKKRPDLFKVILDSVYNKAQRNRDHIYDEQKKKRLKVE